MQTEVFYEKNLTVKIILNDDDCVIIEIYRYFDDYEQLTVSFDFINCDFEFIVNKYENNQLTF